ncbi:hypothetical protein Sste5346_001551 [Sporothrix stenoceras]|uniref:F-box domain-containing protein n=1 Tax=Sporothrix stenoceras TaxID=5173 RepID=A0ABR3ZMB0_9PEZI
MSGDADLGAAGSSSSSSTIPSDTMAAVPPTSAPALDVVVKAIPVSNSEDVPAPETTTDAPQPTAAESEPQLDGPAPIEEAPATSTKTASTTPTASTALPAEYEALPQPQAPPVAPPTYESEEIIISATDAPVIVTTTTTPPTMTSALAGLGAAAEIIPAVPVPAPALAAAPTIVAAVANAAAATITTPLALHPIRSSSAGGPPLSSSNPSKHSKSPANKAVPSEKPVEAAVVDDSHSPSAKKPLTLLELPNDILRLIVKEITHTNDLTSLALTNSTLYNLAVPHIYSRFDIVWPDPNAPVAEGKSVDALTYGLSTLCLGSAFARTSRRLQHLRRGRNATASSASTTKPGSGIFSHQTKFGSPDYAKYTRKFSLGNGPRDWVAEYMINKESGKMLGTLVALCVAKMQNLENFVWDMPTGVVSDVFMALASLPDYDPEHDACKLDRLWIRWHNNSQATPPGSPSTSPSIAPAAPQLFVPQGSNLTPIGILLPSHGGHPPPRPAIPYELNHVEFPTFSVVPPLRNLTVLDIDELAYLDELAVLIERSCSRLTELRIGIAAHATSKDFVQTWDGATLQQVDLDASWPGESTAGERRLGGVLGILVGRVYDIRRKPAPAPKNINNTTATTAMATNAAANETNETTTNTASTTDDGETTPVASTTTQSDLASASSQPTPSSSSSSSSAAAAAAAAAPHIPHSSPPIFTPAAEDVDVPLGSLNNSSSRNDRDHDHDDGTEDAEAAQRLDRKLRLTTLELERVPLSMQVLVRAIDWSTLTTLTILRCPQHDSLWRQLKKHFRPTASYSGHGFGIAPTSNAPSPSAPMRYHMALKSIHTDIVSKALLSFIRDTLAPNSLEVLFLQNRRQSDASNQVTIQDIFKSAIKPHRASLQKLLIDGNLRTETDHLEGSRRRRIWTVTPEILNYLTSGRMTSLRELAFTLNYAHWHTFLQRLPQLPQLRSLHIQHIVDHVVEPLSPYDLAMQIADIVTLRPEVQLCFVGIGAKCYEVVELHGSERGDDGGDNATSNAGGGGADSVDGSIHDGTDTSSTSSDDDEEDDDDDSGDDDEDDDDDDAPPPHPHHDFVPDAAAHTHDSDDADHLSDSGDSDDSFLEGGDAVARPPRLQMREIFFYDDKVSIFKARHGRL